ncbi:hypothetical protein [Rhizobium leguminosarum]|uniref:hypothetical protein n=1 Tax=Rhizobium leguminosarum TaxID=384 RepID=UPI001C97A8AF|nr:hypothetical protein [Rhizobium leguminosarum]MBY5585080.1 hypothetical protein [Rhizobium leguminosarum]
MYLRVSQSPVVLFFKTSVAFMLLIFLMSCSPSFKGGPDRVVTQTSVKAYFASGFSPGQYSNYRASSGTERLSLRNSIVLSTMGAMDVEYTRFEQQLTSERQGVPLLATTTSLALSATSTVVGNATTKAGLAAADTFLKGTKEAYDKEVLANQTIGVLQTQMRANRSAVRSRIIRLLAQSDDAYPLELALADMEDYYSAGTITSGLIGINAQASESLAATESARVDTVSRFGPNDATAAIRRALTQGGKTEVARLQAWMRARNINVPIAIFLNAAEYGKYRDAYASTL